MSVQAGPLNRGSGEAGAIEVIEPLCAVFRRRLKAEGLKYTPERAQILNTIFELDGIFEAEGLMERTRDTGMRISKATVYRTLKLLEDAGIIEQVPFGRDHQHFQLIYGQKPDAVLINLDTGDAVQVALPELAEALTALCKRRGLKLKGHRLQVFVGETA